AVPALGAGGRREVSGDPSRAGERRARRRGRAAPARASPRDTVARLRAVVRAAAGSLEVMAIRFVIIGGGPAGNQAATHAARLGADVVLVERDVVGGAAHLWDCIPSKAMIATGGAMAFNRRPQRMGPTEADGTVDLD